MKYCFLDIEWSQSDSHDRTAGDEILSIGAVGCDENLKELVRFSSIIRPLCVNNISKESLEFIHATKEEIEEANDAGKVFEKFKEHCPKFEILVMWSRESYDIFLESVEKTGAKLHYSRTLIMQELLAFVDKKGIQRHPGFETTLIKNNLTYNPDKLHYSYYDAELLRKLFQCFKNLWLDWVQKDQESIYIKSIHSKVVHTTKCHIATQINEENKDEIGLDKLLDGYQPCKYCHPNKNFHEVIKKGRLANREAGSASEKGKNKEREKDQKKEKQNGFDESFVSEACNKLGLDCRMGQGVIFVKTPATAWRIFHNYIKVIEVYHENHKYNKDIKTKKRDYNEGFHRQDIVSHKLEDVLQYIKEHDEDLLEKRAFRRTKLEKLLDMVQEQRKR